MQKKLHFKRLSSFQAILLGFALVILLGAILLMLPISSKDRTFTSFYDSIFTSTSAVCVTGLVVKDSATHWSIFGQIIIMLLIQIGGIGIVTVAASVSILAKQKINLGQRSTMQEALAAHDIGGIVKLTWFIVKGIFIVEFIGMLLMLPVFIKDFGIKGIWLSAFHSISAFCNAGFDIMGDHTGQFSSLTAYASNPIINIVIMLLIISGGIGFLTWKDITKYGIKIKKYSVQSKVILTVTAVLILLPALYFFFFEFNDYKFFDRVLLSLFQAITPRTAGFNTANIAAFSEISLFMLIILMVIGGSPGSTAGGMKTTTLAIIISSAFSVFKRKDSPELFKRRISDETVRHAHSICLLYFILFISGGIIISLIEKLPLMTCIFETASAIGTVGLSLGITQQLSLASKIILIGLMFFGRVGGLTLIYATFGGTSNNISKLPIVKITVG